MTHICVTRSPWVKNTKHYIPLSNYICKSTNVVMHYWQHMIVLTFKSPATPPCVQTFIQIKKSKLPATGPFWGNPPLTGGIPSQRASNVETFPCEGASMIHIIFKAGSDSFVTHFSLLIIAHLIYNDALKLPQAVLFSRDMIRFSVKNYLNTPVIFRPTFRYYATRTIVSPFNPSELLYENGLSCCADWLWEWWLKRLITVSFIWNASVYESWKSHWATCVRNFHSNDAHSVTVYKHDLWYYLIMGWSFNVIYNGTQIWWRQDMI